jgi:hypothetical protein
MSEKTGRRKENTMTTVMIANIGQRDLYLDNDALAAKDAGLAAKLRGLREAKKLRAWGHTLDKHYDEVEAFIDAPMLRCAAADLESRGEAADRLVLAATRQRDKAFQAGDTFSCAGVLARWLPAHLPAVFGDSDIAVETIADAPHDLNAALDWYGGLCGNIEADQVYILVTGGTPACNMALSLRAIESFGARCTTLHVSEGAEKPLKLNVVGYVLAQHRKHALKRLVARGDFDAVAFDEGYPETVRALARAAAARFNLDFVASLKALESPVLEGRLDPAWGFVAEARKLARGSRPEVMREVYWNAVMKWRRGECADFLGRMGRLLEASLYSVVARLTGLPDDERRLPKAFAAWIAAPEQQKIHAYIEKKAGKKNQWRINVPILLSALGFFVNKQPDTIVRCGYDKESLIAYQLAAKDLRKLAELRNRSAIAHGFEGLSRDSFNCDGDELFRKIALLLWVEDIEAGRNPFDAYAEALLALNEEDV